ncbi:hypothetical protein [Streptomyces sp. NPDC002722]|uniref:hypothetical protein n=1 Tax=unclassified Streptomyces TaxID=2593676 RepID=UPI003328EC3E
MIIRLEEIEQDLLGRRERAEQEGWKGEVASSAPTPTNEAMASFVLNDRLPEGLPKTALVRR